MSRNLTLMGVGRIGTWGPEEQEMFERARDLLLSAVSLCSALAEHEKSALVEAETHAAKRRSLLLSNHREIARILDEYPALLERLEARAL